METNIQNNGEKRRLSLITDIIIFLVVLNVFIFVLKYAEENYIVFQSLSLEDVEISNKNYIEASYIEEHYGVKLLYGDDAFESAVKVNANVQNNEYRIYDNLLEIKKALGKYPNSFFENTNLTIVILESFNNHNIALASRNKLNEFKIYITNNINFERALHHEMYHVFEYKINVSKNNIFLNWNDYNPKDFKYIENTNNLDEKYIYTSLESKENSYFVTKYSKTSEKEDRAEIFAEIMTLKNKPTYLEEYTNIRKKAETITTMMTVILSEGNDLSFYWNRFK